MEQFQEYQKAEKQSNLISQNQQIYTSPGYIIQGKNEYNNIISNKDQNYFKYNNQNKQKQYNYSNQNNVRKINISPKVNNNITKYESKGGVIRGYNSNCGFYVSGSSQNNTNNNQYNNKINFNYQNNNQNSINNQKRGYNNISPPNKIVQQYQKNIYSNNSQNTLNYNNNLTNRNIIGTKNASYIIKFVDKEPVIYNQSKQQYTNNNNYNINYNNYNNENDIYHFNGNENRVPQRYQGPIIQRRMVKRVVEKEPMDRKDYLVTGPNDNLRNMKKI